MTKSIRSWQIFGISLILVIAWLIIINLSYSSYQNTRATDALAEVKVLFPHFYILIATFAALCIYVLWKRISNKWLHVAMLTEFALMLWLTPYLMSGFVREPDGLWYSGISLNIQEILGGVPFVSSNYAIGYPSSFIFNKSILVVTGTGTIDYAGWLYPFFYVIIFVLLWYIFGVRYFNRNAAFLSGIIAIPALHYLKIHPAPQTIGVILIIFTLILLITHERVEFWILGIVIFLIMIFTHPISPILAIIFLAVAYLPRLFSERKKLISRYKKVLIIAISVFIIALIIFLLFTSLGQSIVQYVQRAISVPLDRGFSLIARFIAGSPFIFTEIYFLAQVIYFCFLILAVLLIYYLLRSTQNSKPIGIKARMLVTIQKVGYRNAVLLCVALLYILFTAILVVMTNAFVLIERGLSFFILFISLFISSNIMIISKSGKSIIIKPRQNKSDDRLKVVCGVGLIILLVLAYPVIAYSVDAYNSFPRSEDNGLDFLTTHTILNDRTIAIGMPGQLSAYMEPPTSYEYTYYLSSISQRQPDTVAFRNSDYYYTAMRRDLSFEDNGYLNLHSEVDSSGSYDKIYESETFEIFVKNKNSA